MARVWHIAAALTIICASIPLESAAYGQRRKSCSPRRGSRLVFQRTTYTAAPGNSYSSYSRSTACSAPGSISHSANAAPPCRNAVAAYPSQPRDGGSSIASSLGGGCGRAQSVLVDGREAILYNGRTLMRDGSAPPTTPFSLSAYTSTQPASRPGVEPQARSTCADHFLACCETGSSNCMSDYIQCVLATGEPLEHSGCPVDDPGDDPPEEPLDP